MEGIWDVDCPASVAIGFPSTDETGSVGGSSCPVSSEIGSAFRDHLSGEIMG